ncbi:MAG TPA: hypothetical protein VF585_10045 [Chthoniobacterales bacterium]
MIRTILVNDTEFAAYEWHEEPISDTPAENAPRHARNSELLAEGVDALSPGEVSFRCDQTLVFDTTFALKGDNRKFVVIESEAGKHVAKPY